MIDGWTLLAIVMVKAYHPQTLVCCLKRKSHQLTYNIMKGGLIMFFTLENVANQLIPDNKILFYQRKLYRMLLELFEWENLPDEIPADYIEKHLIFSGSVVFFYDDRFGHVALVGSGIGYNIYDQPVTAHLHTRKENFRDRTLINEVDLFEPEEFDKNKCGVLIQNMFDGQGMMGIVDFYANRLALIQAAFDVNVAWSGAGPIFKASNKEIANNIRSWAKRILSGEPYTVVDNALTTDLGQNIAEQVPVTFVADKLHDAFNEVYNDFKEAVGLKSPGADKAERLLVDEVNMNQDSTQTTLDMMLSHRQKACDLINAVFGLSVKVKRKESEVHHGQLQSDTGSDPEAGQLPAV